MLGEHTLALLPCRPGREVRPDFLGQHRDSRRAAGGLTGWGEGWNGAARNEWANERAHEGEGARREDRTGS